MAIDWPIGPTSGQTYISPSGTVWIYNGYAWNVLNSGIQGIQGIQGISGDQGLQGTIGIQGSTGEGFQGIQGIQGPTGIQGDIGIQGSTGAGFQGIQGSQGTLGIQGYTGDGDFVNTNFIFVNIKTDLPAPVSGVITLDSSKTYFFTTEVDLTGDRIVCGVNTTILGGSSENCRIKSTGLVGTALITSIYSLPMRNITIEANVALNLDGDATTTAIDWFGVNFTDCPTIGTIKDYSNVIISDCAFLNSGNLTFDGTIGTVGLSTSLFNCNTAGTVFILPATLTISRRFRIIYSSFIVLSGETGINLSATATIPNDAFILTYCNFSGGGTYLGGLNHTSLKSLFINNIGITNTSNVGHYYMQNNATATTIGAGQQNNWFKAGGTTIAGIGNSPKWTTDVTNRLTYTGSVTTDFIITVVGAVQSTANGVTVGVGVAENGAIQLESAITARTTTSGVPFAFSVQNVIQVATGDYFEVFVRNESGTQNVTLVDVNVIIQKVTG